MTHVPAHFRLTANVGRVDIVTAKDLLGHTNINCTMRYAHSKDDAKSAARGGCGPMTE